MANVPTRVRVYVHTPSDAVYTFQRGVWTNVIAPAPNDRARADHRWSFWAFLRELRRRSISPLVTRGTLLPPPTPAEA